MQFFIGSFISTLLASILGSTHCVAMCGGFSCLAGSGVTSKKSGLQNVSLYNIGRLISYLIIANLIVLSDLSLKNLSRISSFSGMLLFLVILFQALYFLGLGNRLAKIPGITEANSIYTRMYGRLITRASNMNSHLSKLLLGLLSALIPCGWLYLNLSLASAQNNLLQSNLLVFSFWLGTLPALSLVGLGVNLFGKNLKGLPQTLAYVIVIGLSLYSLNKHFPSLFSLEGVDSALCHIIKI